MGSEILWTGASEKERICKGTRATMSLPRGAPEPGSLDDIGSRLGRRALGDNKNSPYG